MDSKDNARLSLRLDKGQNRFQVLSELPYSDSNFLSLCCVGFCNRPVSMDEGRLSIAAINAGPLPSSYEDIYHIPDRSKADWGVLDDTLSDVTDFMDHFHIRGWVGRGFFLTEDQEQFIQREFLQKLHDTASGLSFYRWSHHDDFKLWDYT